MANKKWLFRAMYAVIFVVLVCQQGVLGAALPAENRLIKALEADKKSLAKLFARGGKFDINETASDGLTPLHKAINKGFTEVVHELLEKGANVNKKSSDGLTPLDRALAMGNIKHSIIRDLVIHGASLSQPFVEQPVNLQAKDFSPEDNLLLKLLSHMINTGQEQSLSVVFKVILLPGEQRMLLSQKVAAALASSRPNQAQKNCLRQLEQAIASEERVRLQQEKSWQGEMQEYQKQPPQLHQGDVFLYNANVPLEAVWITESDPRQHIQHHGIYLGGPEKRPENRELWSIKIPEPAKRNQPCIVSIETSSGKVFRWPLDRAPAPEHDLHLIAKTTGKPLEQSDIELSTQEN